MITPDRCHRLARIAVPAVLLLAVLQVTVAFAFEPAPNLPRSEIPEEFRWDHRHLFATEAAFEAELTAFGDDLASLADYEGLLASGPDRLFACLEDVEVFTDRLMCLDSYAGLLLDVEQEEFDEIWTEAYGG